MAWANAQGAGADQSGTTGTQAFPGNCTAGSILVATVRLGTGTFTSVTDPTNGTWNARVNITDASGDRFVVCEVVNTATTALTVTLNNGTSTTRRWTIEEFTESGTLSFDVADAGANGTSATTAATAGVTTATNNELLSGGCELSNGATMTGTGGTTVIRNVAAGKMCSAWATIATAGSGKTLNFSWTGADTFACGAVAHQASAGGATYNAVPVLEYYLTRRQTGVFH